MQTSKALFTPDSLAAPSVFVLTLPNDLTGWAAMNLVMSILSDPDTWLQSGSMTPEEVAEVFLGYYILLSSQF